MFVTEIRPLNKKKSRILFDDGEDLVLYNGEIRASRIKEQQIHRAVFGPFSQHFPCQLFVNLIGKLLLLFDAGSADFPVIKNQILSVI